jgi:hypothetical protein
VRCLRSSVASIVLTVPRSSVVEVAKAGVIDDDRLVEVLLLLLLTSTALDDESGCSLTSSSSVANGIAAVDVDDA